MSLINCPKCGHKCSDRAKACPNCGAPISNGFSSSNSTPVWLWPVVAGIALIVIGVIATVILKQSKPKTEATQVEVASSAEGAIEAPAVADEAPVKSTRDQVLEVLQVWNDTHNDRDYTLMETVYAPKLHYYTQDMTGKQAVEYCRKAIGTSPWKQYIVGDPTVTEMDNGRVKVSFDKHTVSSGKESDYPSYLIMSKINGDWRIVHESDEITDANVARKKIKVPKDAIKGDFDGDGIQESVWFTGPKKSDGSWEFYTGNMTLKSNNPKIDGLTIASNGNFIGIEMRNVGKLDDSGRDYLGLVPYGPSSFWKEYRLFGFNGARWKEAVEPFSIWIGNDDYDRVRRDYDNPGYVIISTNNMDEDGFPNRYKSVRLKR